MKQDSMKGENSGSGLVVGVDLGKTTACMATAVVGEDGAVADIRCRSERHLGDPLGLFSRWYQELDPSAISGMAATGLFGERLQPPVVHGVPEETAQEIATKRLYPEQRPINVIRLGGRGYSILTLDQRDRVRFEENDKCSSGTGETAEKICKRLGLRLEEAIELAARAEESIPVSARCSVFVKSEITHFGNQGEPHDKLILGYFESVARNLFSLYDKYKLPGPVILVGNGALIRPVADAFAAMSPFPVRVSPQAGVYEAIGAMYLAAEHVQQTPEARPETGAGHRSVRWPVHGAALIREKQRRIRRLEPAANVADRVIRLQDGGAQVPQDSPAIMGIDLGSTGSKAALVDLRTGQPIVDLYRRTDGNPVQAAKALVAGLSQMTRHPVQAVGLTGSGRYAAATVFRAAYPEQSGRIYVENEILAHARAAIEYDEQKGNSVSIVEIGGQDAKFINIQGGRVVESDMNRACSAGTGSFLEEQAAFYGLDDIAAVGAMARGANSPPDLGQMCTVFVADLASEALSEGYTLEDLFAGFQYSVITNYKNRVMGNRRFMDRIFFQGKPATDPSLALTLAAVTGREVVVPPNPGAMGAVGIALMARDVLSDSDQAQPFDLDRILNAAITSKKTSRCRDPKCHNLCRVESATVEIGDQAKTIVSGGRCPKYEEAFATARKLPKEAPDPYREREALVDEFVGDRGGEVGAPTVGIPYGHCLMEFAPFFTVFFRELGLRPKLGRSDGHTLLRGDSRCSAANTCTPVKVMHGLADGSVDVLFLPKIVEVPRDVRGKSGAGTCPMTQAGPEMIEKALRGEGTEVALLRPCFHLADGFDSWRFALELKGFCDELARHVPLANGGLTAFYRAYRKASRAQQAYQRGLWEIGLRALRFARDRGYPVVLVTGNCHVIHEPIMNAGIHEIVSHNGAMALPVDCFPVAQNVPPLQRVYWQSANRTLRASIAAAQQGGVFPALILGYGCGPGSFLEQLFSDLMEHYPHTVLESDGHGGQAGYVTRVQAFLHAARSYVRSGQPPVSLDRIRSYDRFPEHSLEELESSRISVMTVGPALGRHITACLQARGYEAEFSGLSDASGLEKGRLSCTGKECLPYQLIWGSFAKSLEQNPPGDERKTLLLNVTGFGPCRNGMFTLGNEIALRKMGLEDRVESLTYGSLMGDRRLFAGIFCSIVTTDLLNNMRCHYRAVESNPGESDRLFREYIDRTEALLREAAGARRLGSVFRYLPALEAMIAEAAGAYRSIQTVEERKQQARTVFLCGDIFLRIDEWGSDELARKLNHYGLHVMPEPFADMFEFLLLHRSPELVELDSRWFHNRTSRFGLNMLVRRLYGAARRVLPFIRHFSIQKVDRESRQLLDGVPFSESLLTIGTALLAWRTHPVDGVVVVGPWGCGPALISESQLRRRTDIPLLFVYNDGDPIEEARVAGFAWRLKRRPARSRASSQVSHNRSAAV